MAKQMSWTDPDTGVVYPEMTWTLIDLRLSVIDPKGSVVTFGAFKDAATAKAVVSRAFGGDGAGARDTIGKANKTYSLSTDQFAAFALAMSSGPTNNVTQLSEQAYRVAMTTLDTPDPDDPAELVSFFAGAKDVAIS